MVRERTRLIEREESRKSDVSFRMAGGGRLKGKNKAKDISGFGRPELDDETLRVRYKEAVDEKKGQQSCLFRLTSLKLDMMSSPGSSSYLTPLTPHAANRRALLSSEVSH